MLHALLKDSLDDPLFLDNPHGWVMHIPFAFFIIQVLKPSVFVELGTYSGNSYFAFCQSVKKHFLKTRCFAIDTWKGDIHVGNYDDSVFQRVNEINEREYASFSTLKKMSFDEAIHQFDDSSIDLLHIDGTHTYQAVRNDFYNWLPKLSQKGVVLVHDTRVWRNNFMVWKFWDEVKDQFPSYEFEYGEGLGVLCVGNNIPEEFSGFIRDLSEEPFYSLFFEKMGERIVSKANVNFTKEQLQALKKERAAMNIEIIQLKKQIKSLNKKIKSGNQTT